MNTWILFWKIFFVLTLAIFIQMAVLVSWFGAADIRRLLDRLKSDDETVEEHPPSD
jgi:hypothetical protein